MKAVGTMLALLVSMLVTRGPASAGEALQTPEAMLDSVRIWYHRSVEDAGAIEAGVAFLDRLEAGAESAEINSLTRAYRGSFELVRARHGWWPPRRLAQVRDGMRWIDEAVSMVPEAVEVRYLRLSAELHLPSLFRRDEVIRDDLDVLRRWIAGGAAAGGQGDSLDREMRCRIRAFVDAVEASGVGASSDPPVPSLPGVGRILECPPPE